jgi:hypothetical protein
MKLLDFFAKQLDAIDEDDHAIRLKRDYRIGDLSDTLGIYEECCKVGISPQIEFVLESESFHEVVLSNFKLQQKGITSLINSVMHARRADFTYKLSSAKSIQYDNSRLAEALEEPFSECLNSLKLSVYVPKADLCENFQKDYSSDLNFGFWLTLRNFTSFIRNQTERFLRIVWGGMFPVFVVYDIQAELRCKFCKVIPMNSEIREEIDREAYNIFCNLATEIISRRNGTAFLLNLTLCPLDSKSRTLLENYIDNRIVEEQNPLRFGESQFYDFKAKPAEIARNVTAFANACGGMLIYGIENDGRIQGCDPSRVPDSVSNAIREVQPPVRCEMLGSYIDGKYVLVLIVAAASDDIVYTDGAGQRPFRYLASTRLLRTDKEVLDTRRSQCGDSH